MTKQETILNAIRTACPELMELGLGCLFTDGYNEFIAVSEDGAVLALGGYNGIDYDDPSLYYVDERYGEFKIIGHEPRLEHLLRAIHSVHMAMISSDNKLTILNDGVYERFSYDLTKSVTENLQDNEELTDYLFTLFNQEDL